MSKLENFSLNHPVLFWTSTAIFSFVFAAYLIWLLMLAGTLPASGQTPQQMKEQTQTLPVHLSAENIAKMHDEARDRPLRIFIEKHCRVIAPTTGGTFGTGTRSLPTIGEIICDKVETP